jgi:hypothetical protein
VTDKGGLLCGREANLELLALLVITLEDYVFSAGYKIK